MENPNRFYTYAYLREDRTPYYIGKGQTKRAYRKDGKPCRVPKDKSRIILLKQNLTEEQAFKHEIYMIAVLGKKDNGTGILRNKTDGGEGISGLIHTPETRAKMSASRKGEKSCMYGKTLSPETRAKISASRKGENHPNYGKTHSPETKAKMSDALKGEKNPNYGKPLSPEHRAKISNAEKGKMWITNGNIRRRILSNDIIPEGFVKGMTVSQAAQDT
jgi:hypothetical protein